MLTQKQQDAIIDAAVQAPSADNMPPWEYCWDESGQALHFYRHAQRTGVATDGTYVLSNLATAAAVENACLKASTFGYSHSVQYLGDSDNHFATITLTASDAEPSEINKLLAEQIYSRCTNRTFPFKGTLDETVKNSLAQVIDESSCQLQVIDKGKLFKQFVVIIKQAEGIRFRHPSLHQELFKTVNMTETSPATGMTLDMLGIEKPARPFFRHIKNWPNMRRLNRIGMSHGIAMRSVSIPFTASPSMAILTTDSSDQSGVINAGRQMQRFWLMATSLGLAVHPYAAPGALTLAMDSQPPEIQQELQSVKDKLSVLLPQGQRAVMFFRLGYSDKCTTKSGRLDARELLKQVS